MSRNKNSRKSPKFTADTKLTETGLVHIDVVLTERFLLPPASLVKIGEKVPTTLGDVSELSGQTLEDICDVIGECIEIGRDIWLQVNDLGAAAAEEGSILVDIRPGVTFETEPLHPSARLFHTENPQVILPFLRALKRVLVISHSDDHAWSAAMSLRKMGIHAWIPRENPEARH